MGIYGKQTVGGSSSTASWARAMAILPNTFAVGDTLLKSMSMYVGSTHSGQCRFAVYQSDSENSPVGGDLIVDLGETSGSATNQFLTITANDEVLDPTRTTWVAMKRTSGFTAHYDGAGGDKGDYDPDDGRFNSTSISTSSSVAWPSTWPSGGSQSDIWYSSYITVAGTTPVITNCVPSITLTNSDTGVVATGGNFEATQGTTEIQLSDNATYGSGTLVDQDVNTWSDTSIDFDIVVDSLPLGDLFLFVVKDPGGGGEEPSVAFPVTVRVPNDLYVGKQLVTPGSTGIQDLDVGFAPTAAVIWWTSNTSQDTIQANYRTAVFLWTAPASATLHAGVNTGAAQQRQQIGSVLNIREGGSSTDQATATVTASGDNLRFDWTLATTGGYTLNMIVFGGTVTPHQDQATVSDGSYSGTAFEFDLMFASSIGSASFPSSGEAALWCLGCCTDASNQFIGHLFGGGSLSSAVNSGIRTNGFANQIQGTVETWVAALTSKNSDGFAWSGSNADGFSFLALKFLSKQVNIDTFVKDSSGTPGATQSIGSQGFIPGLMMFLNGHRASETPSSGDSCMSIGFSDDLETNEASTICTSNPSDNADEATHTTGCIRGGDIDASSDAIGTIDTWQDNPVIEWSTNDTVAAIVGYLSFERLGFPQDVTQDDAPPFMGIVPSGDMVVTLAALIMQDVPNPFVGIVPSGDMNAIALINDLQDVVTGFVSVPKIVVADHDITQDETPFVGIVPEPTLPTPSVSLTQLPVPFVGLVPSQLVKGEDQDVTQDPVPFVGFVPVPAIVTTVDILQDPVPFVGFVPEPALTTTVDILQDETPFVGIVPIPAILAGAGPDITQSPVPFVGIVPTQSVVPLIGQDPVPFVGLVPNPTITAGASPNITQLPVPFVGLVPNPSLSQDLGQAVTPFVGIVPEPRGVVLRDAPGRRILAAETI